VITAVGSATMQLAIVEDQFLTFGTFDVERGQYLFTAGDVFTRRFELEPGGTLVWDGDPIDARLDLPAAYRTRAAVAGLGLPGVDERQRVPVVVRLDVSGRVTGPLVALSLTVDEAAGRQVAAGEALRLRLNEPDRQAEYATSVLLTNTFLLAPSEGAATLGEAADDLLFTSLSELVSSRLSLFLNQALGADNLDVALGLQQGVNPQEFDLTYGLALRLLDERLVIRGEGVYQQLEDRTAAEGLQGEVAVEVRLADGVALEVFYRREGDPLLGSGLAALPSGAYGAGVTYRTEFSSWAGLLRRLRGTPPTGSPATADASPP
jgi:translocation and assembly module TamB